MAPTSRVICLTYKGYQEERANNTYGYAPGSAITEEYPYEYKCFNIGAVPTSTPSPGTPDHAKKHCVVGTTNIPIGCNDVSKSWKWCGTGSTSDDCLTK